MNPEHPEISIRFTPVMDWWVAVVAGIFLLVLCASIPVVIWNTTFLPVTVGATLVLIGSFLLILDRAFFTAYYMEPEGLRITGQLRSVFIPYHSIKKVTPKGISGLISRIGHKRFALSRDNLTLYLEGEMWKSISVSPHQKQLFIQYLLEAIGLEKADFSKAAKKRSRKRKA